MLKEKAEKLYKKVNTCIITITGADGYPLTKAVLPGKYRETIQEMYFCTNTSSNFASQIAKSVKAAVYFYSRKLFWKGCLLQGQMEIVNDMQIKQKYWQHRFKNAYPEKSYTDPDFCVLRFIPVSVRYYANFTPQDFTV